MSFPRSSKIKRPGAVSALTTALAVLMSSGVQAEVDLDKLHTPRSYLSYLPQLFDGANLMQASERCQTFLSGKVKIDASTLEHPRFVYACRDDEGQTYRWQVDGLSLEVVDPTRPNGRVSFQQLQAEIEAERDAQRQRQQERQAKIDQLQAEREKIEQARQAESERREQEKARQREVQRRSRIWTHCMERLTRQTRNMSGRAWVTQQQPESVAVDDKTRRFVIDFNARNRYDTPLHYRAFCEFGMEGEAVTLRIHPRSLSSARHASQSSRASSASSSVARQP